MANISQAGQRRSGEACRPLTLSIVWFRRDLRTRDHEALSAAAAASDVLLPLYCLDPRDFEPRRPPPEGLGLPKLGPHRCRFLLEGLACLRRDLGALGSGLVFRVGAPEEELPRLLRHACSAMAADPGNDGSNDGASELGQAARRPEAVVLHHHYDLMEESVVCERAVADALGREAKALGIPLSVHGHWGLTLYNPDDLPYRSFGLGRQQDQARQDGLQQQQPAPNIACQPRYRVLPPVMTDFRKVVQGQAEVRKVLPAPERLPPLPAAFACGLQPCAGAATAAGVGHIPASVAEAYNAAGAASQLQALQQLTGVEYAGLAVAAGQERGGPGPGPGGGPPQQPAAGSGVDARTAFPFAAGQDSAMERLRYYVWGDEGSPNCPAITAAVQGAQRAAGDQGTLQDASRQPTPDAPGSPGPSQAGTAGSGDGTGPRTGGVSGAGSGSLAAPRSHCGLSPPSLQYYTNTRAQAVGVDSSTKLSPFVAMGMITPRQVHEEVAQVRQAAQAAGVPEAECDWLAMHLCIRDFFIFTALKEGEAMMAERGIKGQPVEWRHDREAFGRWVRGETGLPFVDACMRELAATGWMSNRGRQNVASLLTKDLHVDWRWGAELFECLLLDHDVGVNSCNWNYFAGIGNDPRNRHFKTVTQGMQYDEDGKLIEAWLPQLAHLPPPLRHQPFSMTPQQASQYGLVLGADYPLPMVDVATQVGVIGPKAKKGGSKGRSGRKPGPDAGPGQGSRHISAPHMPAALNAVLRKE